MTKDEALRLALGALENINRAMPFPVAKLAIKECRAALEAKDEPVAVWGLFEDGWNSIADPEWMESLPVGTRLYTTPPQRKPLTDEEVLTYRHMIDWTAEWSYINFARAIEAAHGIKGEA
jgi:hypothetical protein